MNTSDRLLPSQLSDLLAVACSEDPDGTAIIEPGRQWSYRELEQRSRNVAARLNAEATFAPGERVGLLIRPSGNFIAGFLGIIKAGGVAVPLSTKASTQELRFYEDKASIGVVITEAELVASAEAFPHVLVSERDFDEEAPEGEEPRHPKAGDDAAIFFTTGTSANAKAVRLSHRSVLGALEAMVEAFGTQSTDVGLCHTPLYHVSLNFMPLPLLAVGGTVVMDFEFSPKRGWELLRDHRVTQVMTVVATGLLIAKYAATLPGRPTLPHLRKVFTGGSMVSPEFGQLWSVLAPQASIVNSFGMTEMNSGIARSDRDKTEVRPGSVGLPYPDVQVRIGDGTAPVGSIDTIWATGPRQMSGYLFESEATEGAVVDGWLRTGDLGYLDEDGYLYVVGRADAQIKRGGQIVQPDEVESVLSSLDAVLEAAVLPRPDTILGSRIAAVVALKPETFIDGEAILEQIADKIADYKWPDLMAIQNRELPKSATGKLDRRALTDLIDAGDITLSDLSVCCKKLRTKDTPRSDCDE